ncbi:MAG TPA: thioredoxin domain-containing protein [Thiobacillus sp.]|jgi:protein-disulfide isomerase|nr:thioredoxin domain-containing protein [Thiobacillus sp.]
MKKTLFISAAVILLLAFVGGAIFFGAEKAEQAGQRVDKNQSVLVREHSPTLGHADARVEIVEFIDPACGTCRHFYPLVKEMLAAHPDRIRLVLRYAPFHQNADYVVALVEAAGKQGKYWETLETLLAAQDDWVMNHAVQPEQVWRHVEGLGLDLAQLRSDMDAPEIARLIAQDLEDANTLKVTQTPEFFVNGKPLPSFGYEPLKKLVDETLASEYR